MESTGNYKVTCEYLNPFLVSPGIFEVLGTDWV